MKSVFRHYGPVALLLACILLVATLLSLFAGQGGVDDPRPQVLATTYPLYVAAQNILGDTDGVSLRMLSGTGAGCLHDYQLSPADRLALERADLVLVNGAGAELFLGGIDLGDRVVDTSAHVTDLICTEHHHHEGEEHHHEEAAYNEHLWVSPQSYITQVSAAMTALCRLDSAHASEYILNGNDYIIEIENLWQKMQALNLTGRPCVLFHDSLSYLARDLGLSVELTLSAEGESGIAAADLAAVEALAAQHPDLLLLYDTQYPIRYTAVDGLVPAGQVLALETAVVGENRPDDWLTAMGENYEKLQKLTEGGDLP